ncbi:transposase [Chryseobacterium culicis]|uniref:Uncharacterized protein n=1 Tax=Chryseobacterium culicis TaxID=680127 RepID=A0A1H6H6A6_CHRCI|nr:transposase [Chryseobacterium culicis]SEH29794.1 hypothetical protein SAMN05421593_1183 [Chryseobacterium culicis]
MNFKNIQIGKMIEIKVKEREIEISRISNFLHCKEEAISKMYKAKSLDTELLLKWSKLLEYDFFRIYCQHLILYAPPSSEVKNIKTKLPRFRKNIYTREIINYIIEQINSGAMSKTDVIELYRIPKTTLYKWLDKYK